MTDAILLTSPPAPPSLFHAIAPCLLMFVTGSVFALSVFTVPIEQNASIPGALDGLWPATMGLTHFLSAPVMMLTGIFLDSGINIPYFHSAFRFTSSKTARVRTLCAISTFSYATFALAAIAISTSSTLLIRVSVALQSLPLGINYLLNTELLLAWFPQRPGFMVGCALVAAGLGSIVLSWVFNHLIQALGIVAALAATAIILTLANLIPTFFVSWPPPTNNQSKVNTTCGENTPLIHKPEISVHLSWTTLCSTRELWTYIGVVICTGAPYALTPFFFKLGYIFGKPSALMVYIFQVIEAVAIVVGLIAGWLSDVLRFGNGFFSSGAKNLAILCLTLQALLFALMVPLSNSNRFWGFMVSSGILIALAASHYGCSAIMARDMFGPANSALVLGIGAGLALGLSEGLSAQIMAAVEATNGTQMPLTPASYNAFYIIAMIWSLIGLTCALSMQVCGLAFRPESSVEINCKPRDDRYSRNEGDLITV